MFLRDALVIALTSSALVVPVAMSSPRSAHAPWRTVAPQNLALEELAQVFEHYRVVNGRLPSPADMAAAAAIQQIRCGSTFLVERDDGAVKLVASSGAQLWLDTCESA